MYFALYELIYQYELSVWGGASVTILNIHTSCKLNNLIRKCERLLWKDQRGEIIRIWMYLKGNIFIKKKKKNTIMFMFLNVLLKVEFLKTKDKIERIIFLSNRYAFKFFGQSLIDYLGLTYFKIILFQL